MAIKEVGFEIKKLQSLKNKPKNLYYIGNPKLLTKPIVAIVGSRKANQYAKRLTYELANELAKRGVVVVSGAAMGIDALAHKGAGAKNTIAVVANGLDIRYPKVNASLIQAIENDGLVLSAYEEGFEARPWCFVARNEIVVALADAVVIAQADSKSGSMVSAKLATKMQKELFVFPHRIGESEGTNTLAKNGDAKVIYDIDDFCNRYGEISQSDDAVIEFAKTHPSYEEAVAKFGDLIFEYELNGKIAVKEGRVVAL
jgi:DNA processing protein